MDNTEEIVSAIGGALDDIGFYYCFDARRNTFLFGINLGGKLKNCQCRVCVEEKDYTTYTTLPLSADEDDEAQRAEINEFVNRVNYCVKFGCFEFDNNDGDIRFRHSVFCGAEIPAPLLVRDSLLLGAKMVKNYAEGFFRIMFQNTDAEEAYHLCESAAEQDDEDEPEETWEGPDDEEFMDAEFIREYYSQILGRIGEEPDGEDDDPDETPEAPADGEEDTERQLAITLYSGTEETGTEDTDDEDNPF